MTKRFLAVAAAMLTALPLLSGPVMAQDKPTGKTEEVKPDDGKLICRTDNPTGTRVGAKKVCKTRTEWAEFVRQQREDTQRVQNEALNERIQSGN
ncbi:hypothetical protein [Niveispirillum fermenti]|uniref:hypothetical protein n=1 Tax=Niveispirillum fermenti TaxID=1233113 RepID=UPI003A8C30E8